jgi:putative addiction module component (TIGR02574 family)
MKNQFIKCGSAIMLTTKKLIEQALSLPVEERALIADSLLRSLNVPDTAIDPKWTEVAKRRLQELRSGKVKPIPGDEVFSEVLERFAK